MIDSLRNTYLILSLSLALFFSPGFRAGFPSTGTHTHARGCSTYMHTSHVSMELRAWNEIRALVREGLDVHDKYEIPSADYVLLSFAWVATLCSRIVAWEKKSSVSVASSARFRLDSCACDDLSMIRDDALPPTNEFKDQISEAKCVFGSFNSRNV